MLSRRSQIKSDTRANPVKSASPVPVAFLQAIVAPARQAVATLLREMVSNAVRRCVTDSEELET
jgi:hypothetical protein